jgi:hypothetical protein
MDAVVTESALAGIEPVTSSVSVKPDLRLDVA